MKIYVIVEVGSGAYVQAFATREAAECYLELTSGFKGLFILEEQI